MFCHIHKKLYGFHTNIFLLTQYLPNFGTISNKHDYLPKFGTKHYSSYKTQDYLPNFGINA